MEATICTILFFAFVGILAGAGIYLVEKYQK